MNRLVILGVAAGVFALVSNSCSTSADASSRDEVATRSVPGDIVVFDDTLWFRGPGREAVEVPPGAYSVVGDRASGLLALSNDAAETFLVEAVGDLHSAAVGEPAVALVDLEQGARELVVALPNGTCLSAVGRTTEVSTRDLQDPPPKGRLSPDDSLRERLRLGRLQSAAAKPVLQPPMPSATALTVGFTWWMEPHFGLDENNNGVVDMPNTPEYAQNNAKEGKFAMDGKFGVSMKPEVKGVPAGTSVRRFRWSLSRVGANEGAIVQEDAIEDAPAGEQPLFRGNLVATYAYSKPLAEGVYSVTLEAFGAAPDGSNAWQKSCTREVVVEDILIVAIGDSFGSGEGVPEHVTRSTRKLTLKEAAEAAAGLVVKTALVAGTAAAGGAAVVVGGSAAQAGAITLPPGSRPGGATLPPGAGPKMFTRDVEDGEPDEETSLRGWDPKKGLKKAAKTVGAAAGQAADAGKGVVNNIGDASKVAANTAESAGKAVVNTAESAEKAVGTAAGKFGRWARQTAGSAESKAKDLRDWIKDEIEDLLDMIPRGTMSTRETFWGDDGVGGDGLVRRVILRQTAEKKLHGARITGSSPVARDHVRAHRSSLAWPAQVALAIERADRLTSVTFVSVAASGATMQKGLIDGYGGVYGERDENDADYAKDDWKGEADVPAQIERVRQLVGDRKIDVLLISVGGNDAGFSQILTALLLHGYKPQLYGIKYDDISKALHNGHWSKVLDFKEPWFVSLRSALVGKSLWDNVTGLDGLAGDFQKLADAIKTLNVGRVYLNQYPDLTGGMQCDRMLEAALSSSVDDDYVSAQSLVKALENVYMDRGEIEWAYQNAYLPINAALAAAAVKHGWTLVPADAERFKGHGICAGPPTGDFDNYRLRFAGIAYPNGVVPVNGDAAATWFRTLNAARRIQGETVGGVHPNEFGHQAMKDRFLEIWNSGQRPQRAPRVPGAVK